MKTGQSDTAVGLRVSKTERGFAIVEFKDRYGSECSLQKSSLATDDAIWFGVDDAKPQIMCSDAIRLGLRERKYTEDDNGWCDYKIPNEVLLTTRMHLTVEQVKALLPFLKKFVRDGEI